MQLSELTGVGRTPPLPLSVALADAAVLRTCNC